ncbi:hypothetical protein QBC35DRAFT_453098 [Podospora australis]|uniref:Uncharacterized protein n=1 Tax=Podospora australis TaxID=1536484 RepID=A0AAN6WSJ7_9PEZI|nr:hypothetical protein QBC35DRAFT_453098 [Podospora australis]
MDSRSSDIENGGTAPTHVATASNSSPAQQIQGQPVQQPPSADSLPIRLYPTNRPLPPPPRLWEPRCNHSTMSTFYQETFKCEWCRKRGEFGWLYRCTLDRDPMLVGAHQMGHCVAYDILGMEFSEEMSLGKFGADARSRKNNLLHEISQEQLWSYTPLQLALLLAQRDNVHETIQEERHKEPRLANKVRLKYPDDTRPWIPDQKYECQFKVCHRCMGLGRDKSWVSLNSILNGDILPSVATGFSFNYIGGRPCADARAVQNLGYRPVPLPREHEARVPALSDLELSPSPSPSLSVTEDILHEHLGATADQTTAASSSASTNDLTSYSSTAASQPPQELPSVAVEFLHALSVRLPDVDAEEELFLADTLHTAMEGVEEGTGIFGGAPLEVIEGIALTEEAVESGTADIMASTPAQL